MAVGKFQIRHPANSDLGEISQKNWDLAQLLPRYIQSGSSRRARIGECDCLAYGPGSWERSFGDSTVSLSLAHRRALVCGRASSTAAGQQE